MSEAALRTGALQFDEASMVHRFNGTLGAEWYAKHQPLQPGSIIRARENLEKQRYSELIRSSFCNHACRRDILHKGTTHVAVGFNDLGILLSCDLREEPSKNVLGPLRFVGLDSSAFSVAKSKVIAEMLKRSVPLDHCLQVWFSATCSKSAARNFAEAAGGVARNEDHKDVKSYLSHWAATTPLPLLQARKLWLKTREGRNGTDIASMKREKDQLRMCQYLLTGDVFDAEKPEVGNPAMWSVPAGAPPLAQGESAFNAVEIDDLAEGPKKDNIAKCLVKVLLQRLQRLRDQIQKGVVRRCELVEADTSIAKWVADQQPWTMSWSNVLDYMTPQHFHRLARACSASGDTVHYAYSMNWTAEVVGTCILDYSDLEQRKQIINVAHRILEETSKLAPAGKLLQLPHHDSPLNSTGYLLAMALHKQWTKYFFDSKYAGQGVKVGLASLQTFNPLATNAACLSLTWTYDANIELKDAAGSKLVDDPFDSLPDCAVS
ncbi:RPAP3, partial [Symbiodinium pilosum]